VQRIVETHLGDCCTGIDVQQRAPKAVAERCGPKPGSSGEIMKLWVLPSASTGFESRDAE